MVEGDTALGKVVDEAQQKAERTPEQHEAVRRRSAPVAVGGVICGVLALALLSTRTIRFDIPPNVYALNLSFCAMMIGIGILFYVRGTSGARGAIVLSILALATGFVGPLMYARQATMWRAEVEQRELGNVESVATAARTYAKEHGGVYPPDMAAMLEGKYLTPDRLISPLGKTAPLTEDVGEMRKKMTPAQLSDAIDQHSDYQYFGSDLVLPKGGGDLPADIVVATSRDALMGTYLSVAYASTPGPELVTLGPDPDQPGPRHDVQTILKATNEARAKLGLPELKEPGVVARGLAAATQ